MNPYLSIVIPCYNEADNIAILCQRVSAAAESYRLDGIEVLLVDDGSTDATWHAIQAASANDPGVTGIRLSRNFGQQMALTCGLDHARGERILILDADLQDPPELLSDMMKKMNEGFDIVYGHRTERKQESRFKKQSAWCFYRVFNRLSDVSIPNDTGDFRLITRQVLDALRSLPERVRFTRGLISWLGFKQTALDYARGARMHGASNYSLSAMFRLALEGLISFSTRPLQLASWLGALMIIVSMALLLYVLISWIFFNTVRGWTSLASIFLLSQAFQWLLLGIIGNYIAVIFRESKARPHYIVAERISHS